MQLNPTLPFCLCAPEPSHEGVPVTSSVLLLPVFFSLQVAVPLVLANRIGERQPVKVVEGLLKAPSGAVQHNVLVHRAFLKSASLPMEQPQNPGRVKSAMYKPAAKEEKLAF